MTADLKANLEKFLAHCQDLKDEDDPSGDGFSREFRELREKQIKEKEEGKFPADEGKKDLNIKKNRYKDILPYDYKRVILNDEDGKDYINASFIEGVEGKNEYIASQGPLPHTVNDFWRMLWQYDIEIVFMACREEEGQPKKAKCKKYWTEVGETEQFGEISVTTEKETLPMKDFYKRKIRAECNGRTHHVTQFHYIGWPDHGVPDHPSILNIMIKYVRRERNNHDVPLVVHCSAGCGRTGTICAIDYAWTLLNRGDISKDFNLFNIIGKFREQRQSLVQTPDQYELVHLVMENLFEEWLKNYNKNNNPDTEELYYNVVLNGETNDDYLLCDDIYVNADEDDEDDIGITDGDEKVLHVLPDDGQIKNSYDNIVIAGKGTRTSCSEVTPPEAGTDQMYSSVNVQKEKHQKEAIKPAPNAKPASLSTGHPVLPPRLYKDEEIKQASTTVTSKKIDSRPPVSVPVNKITEKSMTQSSISSSVPRNFYENVKHGQGQRTPLPQQWTGQPVQLPRQQHHHTAAQQLVSYEKIKTPDGIRDVAKHRTVINTGPRPNKPTHEMVFKIGRNDKIAIPIVGQPVQRAAIPVAYKGTPRAYQGQPIGFPVRQERPKGGSHPQHFTYQRRDPYFF